MARDAELALYPHRAYVKIVETVWSERRIDFTYACISQRLGNLDPAAQFRLNKAAGEFTVQAADNEEGRAILAKLADEVAASDGVLVTRLHPFERAGTDG